MLKVRRNEIASVDAVIGHRGATALLSAVARTSATLEAEWELAKSSANSAT